MATITIVKARKRQWLRSVITLFAFASLVLSQLVLFQPQSLVVDYQLDRLLLKQELYPQNDQRQEAGESKEFHSVLPAAAPPAVPPAVVHQGKEDDVADVSSIPLRRLQRHDGGPHSNRPFFIMHPGPPKTATTTLQKGLWDLHKELLQDNYYYAGMLGSRYKMTSFDALVDPKCQSNVAEAWRNHTANDVANSNNGNDPSLDCWNAFLRDLQELRQQGRNVIVSDERLAELWKNFDRQSGPGKFHWRAVVKALEDWDVRVLLSYRRLSEWLPSAKLQFDKMRGGRRKWPQQGGASFSGMYPHLHTLLKSTGKYKNIEQTLAQYQAHFPNVTIWNQAAPAQRDIVPAFVCDFLPHATTACAKLTQPTDSSKGGSGGRSNMAKSYDYDRVAVAAADANLFNIERLQRGAVTKQFQHFHETTLGLTMKDLPQSCPEQADMERLLEASLAMEKRVLPDFYASSLGKAAHETKFWEAVQKGKYCSVDPSAVIANETYRNFFIGLEAAK